MKKTTDAKIEAMSRTELMNALEKSIGIYNDPASTLEARIKAQEENKTYVEQYNLLSVLAAYAKAMKSDLALQTIVLEHHVETIGVKYETGSFLDDNGKLQRSMTATITYSKKNLSMFEFIDWATARGGKTASGNKVVASVYWKSKLEEQRKLFNSKCLNAVKAEDKGCISKNFAGHVLQDCFDVLLFVDTESGRNAIMPNSDAKNLLALCFAEYREKIKDDDTVSVSIEFATPKRWKLMIQRALYIILSNHAVEYIYDEKSNEDSKKIGKKSEKKSEKKSDAAPADKTDSADAAPAASEESEKK